MRSHPKMWLSSLFLVVVLFAIVYAILPSFAVCPVRKTTSRRTAPVAEEAGEFANEEFPIDIRDAGQVRWLLPALDYDANHERLIRYLIRRGEKVFPTYEVILSDPTATPHEIAGIFGVLRKVHANRRRFVPHVISRLIVAHRGLRVVAVETLGEIGSSKEASPVVALLSDEYRSVAYAAAKTLAGIGGPNEVVAMDVWLRGVAYRDDADLRDHVKKCRDELKKRLESEAKDRGK